jgi:hypothetical protein
MASILLLNRSTHKLIQGAASKQQQVLTKHRVDTLMKQCHLLLISVKEVGVVLWEVVKPLDVLVDTPWTLLQVQELLKLVSHQAHMYVVPMKGLARLGPRHLVTVTKSGGVVSPTRIGGCTKLLGHV